MNICAFCAVYGFALLKIKWTSLTGQAGFALCILMFASACDAQFLVDVVSHLK